MFCFTKLQNYNAKLSDFGLAKDGPTGDKSHVSTRVMGTYGYAAPEYMATGMVHAYIYCSNLSFPIFSVHDVLTSSIPLGIFFVQILSRIKFQSAFPKC